MGDFTEKNLNLNNDSVDIQVIKESDMTSNDSDNDSTNVPNENVMANIGLDLLANSNKMHKSDVEEVDDKNHEEIDLIKNNSDDSEEEAEEQNKKNNSDSSESDDEDDSDSNSDNNQNQNQNYQYTRNEPQQPSLEDIVEEKKKIII